MSFSVRSLMIFTAALAVVMASLSYPAPVVGDLFYTFGLLAIAGGSIAGLYQRASKRAYWVGFVILFASYFCHTVWPSELRNTWTMMQRIGDIPYPTPGMATTRMLSLIYGGLHGDVGLVSGIFRPRSSTVDAAAARFIAFQTIGHTSIATLLGVLGGGLARQLALRASSTTTSSAEENQA